MTDRELMQQALNALCDIIPANANRSEINRIQHSAIAALRERLAHCDRCGKRLGGEGDIHTCTPKPEQEPVVFYRCKGCGHAYEEMEPTRCDCMASDGFDRLEYYTTPPAAKQRQPLTGDQLEEIEMREKPLNGPKSMLNFARAIEAAHGIKEKT